ncbi:hypothetical protein GCM10018966_026270 [Streptomyces yanii]
MADTATRTRWSARTRRPVEPAQYRAIRYTERLDEAAAVGSKGDSYDNALAEAFNSLFKAELIRNKGPWTGINDVEIAVAEYIDWFNRRRLHGELGHVPPAEFLTRGGPRLARRPSGFAPGIKTTSKTAWQRQCLGPWSCFRMAPPEAGGVGLMLEDGNRDGTGGAMGRPR